MVVKTSRDLISELPLELKVGILERLPIRDAARTAVLSTHWNDVWLRLGRLFFNIDFLLWHIRRCSDKSIVPHKIITYILLHRVEPVKKFRVYLSSSSNPKLKQQSYLDEWCLYLSTNVKERILECLPTRDAARTALLSTHWNHVWLRHGPLVFDQDFFECFSKYEGEKGMAQISTINDILMLRAGPVKKFILHLRHASDPKPQQSDLDRGVTALEGNNSNEDKHRRKKKPEETTPLEGSVKAVVKASQTTSEVL
nr:F-box/FBD/LRR-repeat protein At1g13570-like [Ipomoea batatas]